MFQIDINVLDINDNPPVLDRDYGSPKVIEKEDKEIVIVTFSATDRDGLKQSINYTLCLIDSTTHYIWKLQY